MPELDMLSYLMGNRAGGGGGGGSAPVIVPGSTPDITAAAGKVYVCGEVSTLSFTPCASGVCDVVFESGTTPTVLTVPDTVEWPDWFDPDNLEANRVYELNILDGKYGVVTSWAS